MPETRLALQEAAWRLVQPPSTPALGDCRLRVAHTASQPALTYVDQGLMLTRVQRVSCYCVAILAALEAMLKALHMGLWAICPPRRRVIWWWYRAVVTLDIRCNYRRVKRLVVSVYFRGAVWLTAVVLSRTAAPRPLALRVYFTLESAH